MSRGVVAVGGQKVGRISSRSPFLPAPLRGYVDYKTFDQMAGELKA